jgi:cytochrome P450
MSFEWKEKPEDLSMPPPPAAAHFDPSLEAWILSRYADVAAVLQDSRLRPAQSEAVPDMASTRHASQRALAASQLTEWQAEIEPLAYGQAMALPVDRPVDLVGEFAESWCSSIAVRVTRAPVGDLERLIGLARRVSAVAADPDNAASKPEAAPANAEIERSLATGGFPMAGGAFVGLTQTLPGLLATSWLALLRHPTELAALHADPKLIPAAVDELLRYAGLARTVVRFAQTPLALGGAEIAPGQKVILLLNSANRDPRQFADPNRLDVRRRAAGQLALGAGPHSCVGSGLIRMAMAVSTGAFVQRFHAAEVCEPVRWRGGSGFRAPEVLFARRTAAVSGTGD